MCVILLERKNILREEINRAVELIEESCSNVSLSSFYTNSFDGLYNFATEDMRSYYPEFGKLKIFLTVGGSGDQLLNAVKLGAEKIDVFDVNRLSKRQCSQKIGAVRELRPDSLYDYFTLFKEDLYIKFKGILTEEDRIFWDTLYDFKGNREIFNLYPYKQLSKEMIFQINPYLDEDGYEDFQQKLADVEINYIDTDFYSLENSLMNNTYDGMNFSNIYEYLNFGRDVSYENALKYYEFIMKKMYPRLNENGTIMVTYMYAFSDKVREFLKIAKDKGKLTEMAYSGVIPIEQLDLYISGLTSQNYSYTLLLDLFERENISKVATSHVEFGQSFDKSHDMALCLKK